MAIIAVGLLLPVFISSHFFIFKLTQLSHQETFRSLLKQAAPAQLKVVNINPSELYTSSLNITWLDDNREVEINGILYDVVSIKNNGLKVSLVLASDETEGELINKYKTIASGIFNEQNPTKPNVVKDLLDLKFVATRYSSFELSSKVVYPTCVAPVVYFNSTPLSVDTPPPNRLA